MPEPAPTAGGVTPLVRAVAAYGMAGGTTLTLPFEPLDSSCWAELVDGVSSERVLGLLVSAVTEGAFPVKSEQHADLIAQATDAVRFCLALEGELRTVTQVLAAADVQARVLKGPAAAALDYPDPMLRSFFDIDVLVRSGEFDRAAVTLERAGYVRELPEPRPGFDRRFSKGTTLVSSRGLAVDLHRTFAMGPFGLRIDLDDLWEGGESFTTGGHTYEALSGEARLLHACYHATLGDWPPRLVPHRDVAQISLTGRYDEDRLRALCRRWQAEAVLATSVATAWNLLGVTATTPLSSWARSFTPSAADQRAIGLYAGPGSHAALSRGALGAIPGVRDKVRFLRAIAFPDRSYVQSRYASRSARIIRGVRHSLGAGPSR